METPQSAAIGAAKRTKYLLNIVKTLGMHTMLLLCTSKAARPMLIRDEDHRLLFHLKIDSNENRKEKPQQKGKESNLAATPPSISTELKTSSKLFKVRPVFTQRPQLCGLIPISTRMLGRLDVLQWVWRSKSRPLPGPTFPLLKIDGSQILFDVHLQLLRIENTVES